MGQIRAADYPGLNVIGGRWVFRRQIPLRRKPIAAELLNIKHEIAVSLGSDSEEVLSRYAAALADADKKQKDLESRFKLQTRSGVVRRNRQLMRLGSIRLKRGNHLIIPSGAQRMCSAGK